MDGLWINSVLIMMMIAISFGPVSFRRRISAPRQSPMVTIAIPTFNRARHLRHCIKSALAQTYGNFEVLVSNNASTDTTHEVLNEFSDERLRYCPAAEQYWTTAELECLSRQCKGRLRRFFLSDDDRVSPFMICSYRRCP